MNRHQILTVLLALMPLGLHAVPFTSETSAELGANLDINSDGLADIILIDK